MFILMLRLLLSCKRVCGTEENMTASQQSMLPISEIKAHETVVGKHLKNLTEWTILVCIFAVYKPRFSCAWQTHLCGSSMGACCSSSVYALMCIQCETSTRRKFYTEFCALRRHCRKATGPKKKTAQIFEHFSDCPTYIITYSTIVMTILPFKKYSGTASILEP